MSIDWSSLTLTPSDLAIHQLAESWGWLLPNSFAPLLFSNFGDLFYQPESGGVWWLNTGTGEVTQVADSVSQFRELLGTEVANEGFMPHLVEELHAAGKVPGPGECYSYVILPVFAEGTYEVENFNPVPAHEHFAITGHIFNEIQSLPSGAKVRLNVVP
ncbi:T6SS immunity protein Tdi1 domain-containing protein [Azotobacter beijerinckii]|uniref:T6SS immunity protein Tdi1 domain-containing protein n=1 Tax=Azotobacter beijerinckii TaxID=170623 RepID=UPI000B81945B|nr:T6SS immunity protein Tdi1 domain-containing protein [Azotobacter beijerinckii]